MVAASKNKRPMSSQAQAAAVIRKNLKAAFPHTKFSVKSDSFAGGDSVDVSWADGPTTEQVQAFTSRHQYGSFDGMQDLYEYTNTRKDIPQAKYVQAQRSISNAAYIAIVDQLNQRYGWTLEVVIQQGYKGHTYPQITNDEPLGNCSGYKSQEVHRTFYTLTLTCGYCKHGTLPGDRYCPDCGESLDATPALAAAEMILAPR